jgi:serine/threonine protein kinase
VADRAGTLGTRYELHEVIGRGGMAEVHRATDRVLDRDVAVKVLRETSEDESDRARFSAEARMLALLSHSGLVMVLDAGISAARPFIVMELVAGPTLSQLCADGPVERDRVRAIGTQIADALAYAHGQGVVHRDVKPGNVLISPDGRAKLADFGIARLIGDTVRHTRTGHAIGTAAYLAPEQVTGGDVGAPADVYSLGLVLLEALTGERAYPGPPTEAALARLSRPPDVPHALPDSWRGLLTAMTATDPAERPTADEVVARLRHAGVDLGAGATSPLVPAATAPTLTMRVEPAASPRTSMIDRAGDALARQPRSILVRLQRLEPHQRGVLGALAGILVLILVAGLVAGGGGGATTDDGPPDGTPPRLEQPLQDLHDAVHGR